MSSVVFNVFSKRSLCCFQFLTVLTKAEIADRKKKKDECDGCFCFHKSCMVNNSEFDNPFFVPKGLIFPKPIVLNE